MGHDDVEERDLFRPTESTRIPAVVETPEFTPGEKSCQLVGAASEDGSLQRGAGAAFVQLLTPRMALGGFVTSAVHCLSINTISEARSGDAQCVVAWPRERTACSAWVN